jgi:ABC-type Fe3+/spermidine/putrescine transport system ATPase subunit
VAFGLEIQKAPPAQIDRRVTEMLTLVGLEGYGGRDVEALSGGERQRVALARSLAATPRLLMLDEPLGALDRALRQRLLLDIVQILRRIRVTTLFVTHDQQEAFGVADRIAVMEAGRILQVDRPETLYRAPRSATVARFLGLTNLIAGEASATATVRTALGAFSIRSEGPLPPGPLTLLIRPEAAKMATQADAARPGTITGRVTARLFQGNTYRVALRVSDKIRLSFTLPTRPKPPGSGGAIHLRLNPRAMVILAAHSETQ